MGPSAFAGVVALALTFVAASAGAEPVARDHALTLHLSSDGALTLIEALRLENAGGTALTDVRAAIPAGLKLEQAIVDGQPALWRAEDAGVVIIQLSRPLAAGASATLLLQEARPAFPGPATVTKRFLQPADRVVVRFDAPAEAVVAVDGNDVGGGEEGREHVLGPLPEGATVTLSVRPASAGAPLLFVLASLLAATLLATMAAAVRERRRKTAVNPGLLGHLQELTRRLRWILASVILFTFFLFTFAIAAAPLAGVTLYYPWPSFTDNIAAQAFREIVASVLPAGVELIVTSPVDAALVQVEVALFLALLLTSPIVGYHVGAFLAPALHGRERRFLLRSIPAVTGLFAAGAAFAYVLLIPTMLRILYLYAAGIGARAFISVESLVGFAVLVTVAFGLAFQLPVVMYGAARLGLVKSATMARYWRHSIVGIFILAAVITPDPSLVGQLLVAIPLCGLYGVGLMAARVAERPPAAAPAAAQPTV